MSADQQHDKLDGAKPSELALLPGLREALKWKPNTPQLENAMTYAWEQALKSFIRALEASAPLPETGTNNAAGQAQQEAPLGVVESSTGGRPKDRYESGSDSPAPAAPATPRTDKVVTKRVLYNVQGDSEESETVPASFARQLERELASAQAEITVRETANANLHQEITRLRGELAEANRKIALAQDLLYRAKERGELSEDERSAVVSASGAHDDLERRLRAGSMLQKDAGMRNLLRLAADAIGVRSTTQPPKPARFSLTGKQVAQLKDFSFADETDPEEAMPITIGWLPAHEDGPGWYVWAEEYPEEGSLPLQVHAPSEVQSATQERK